MKFEIFNNWKLCLFAPDQFLVPRFLQQIEMIFDRRMRQNCAVDDAPHGDAPTGMFSVNPGTMATQWSGTDALQKQVEISLQKRMTPRENESINFISIKKYLINRHHQIHYTVNSFFSKVKNTGSSKNDKYKRLKIFICLYPPPTH